MILSRCLLITQNDKPLEKTFEQIVEKPFWKKSHHFEKIVEQEFPYSDPCLDYGAYRYYSRFRSFSFPVN